MQKKKGLTRLFYAIAFSLGACCLDSAAIAQGGAAPILIGCNLALTGPGGYGGEAAREGIDLVVDEINASGGLLGRPVKILYRDHESVPDKAITNTRELIQQQKVVAFVGETASGPALAVGQIIGQAGLPWVMGEPTNTTITQRPENKTVYRVSPYDALQGRFVVQEALKRYKKIGVISDTTGFGQGGQRDVLAALSSRGVKPVAVETYTVGSPDLSAQLGRIQSAGADVIIAWSLTGDAAQLVRTERMLNISIPVIGSWGLEGASFLNLAGAYANGVRFVSVDPFDRKTPTVAKFLAAFDKKYGSAKLESPSNVAVSADAMGLLASAIRAAGSTDSKAVLSALQHVSYDGLIKDYRNPWSTTNREALNVDDLRLFVVKDGKFLPSGN